MNWKNKKYNKILQIHTKIEVRQKAQKKNNKKLKTKETKVNLFQNKHSNLNLRKTQAWVVVGLCIIIVCI